MRVYEQYDVRRCKSCNEYFEAEPNDNEDYCVDCLAEEAYIRELEREKHDYENEKREL